MASVAYEGPPIDSATREVFDATPGCETLLLIGRRPETPWADKRPPAFGTVETDDENTAVILPAIGPATP